MNALLKKVVDPDDFTKFDPVPPEGITRAVEVLKSGAMFRYCGARPEDSDVALLERAFANLLGVRYALALSSCTSAIKVALRLLGIGPGMKVLLPGFTFGAVPSAIVLEKAQPIYVECDSNYRMDLDDFRRKVAEHPDAKVLLLSHMRGHICDMDAVMKICKDNGITMIEDAAHALGVFWKGKAAGSFGAFGCFSSQSNKIINSGEGGFLVTNDLEMYVKAILSSGAYEKNGYKHFFGEGDEVAALFERNMNLMPLDNMRMSNLVAAVLLPQLELIAPKGERYRKNYAYVRGQFDGSNRVKFPDESPHEIRIPDSIQFRLVGFSPSQMRTFTDCAKKMGLPIAWFADEGNARHYENWKYAGVKPDLPMTRDALATACDMRWPVDLERHHLDYLVETVNAAIREVESQN